MRIDKRKPAPVAGPGVNDVRMPDGAVLTWFEAHPRPEHKKPPAVAPRSLCDCEACRDE